MDIASAIGGAVIAVLLGAFRVDRSSRTIRDENKQLRTDNDYLRGVITKYCEAEQQPAVVPETLDREVEAFNRRSE